MREKITRFMIGRYGNDRLNQVLMIVSVVFFVLSMFFHGPFYLITVIIMGYCYFRMFSKNISARSTENWWYMHLEQKVKNRIEKQKNKWKQIKYYHIYKCPGCGQKIRVPRGRGRIAVTCRKCGKEFIKKS